jgi:hypothetical protein
VLSAVGGALGLVLGVVWYYAWGCRHCAAGSTVAQIIVFSVACGVVLGNVWGKDHLRSP